MVFRQAGAGKATRCRADGGVWYGLVSGVVSRILKLSIAMKGLATLAPAQWILSAPGPHCFAGCFYLRTGISVSCAARALALKWALFQEEAPMLNTPWKCCLPLAAVMALAACTSDTQRTGLPAGASHALYQLQPASERQALARTPGGDGYLQHLLQDPSTEDIRLVTLTPSLVSSDTRTLSLTLIDGSTVQFDLLRIDDSQPDMTGWIGEVASNRKRDFPSSSEVEMDPFNWISLMRQGDQVVGDIHVKGQAYRLEPVGNGQHVLVKVDESKLPPEAEPVPAPLDASAAPVAGSAPASAHSTIRVLFVTTNQSRARYPNNRLQLAQALQNANQFMINSRVALTYEIAGFYDAAYSETGQDYSAQLAALRSDQTALGKAVYEQRDAFRADLVAMLSTFSNVCGVARLTANKATGYSVISCLGGTLAHELGHNLGVNHGWNPGDPVRDPPYMHGYKRTQAPALHTVMVNSHGAIPYFSNPRLTYQGVPIGTVANHDAARRFNERREIVEKFYPRVVAYTLYEHANFQGRSCVVTHVGTSSSFLRDQCGTGWETLVSSVRIRGFMPGSYLLLTTSGNRGSLSFKSTGYTGDLDVPYLDDTNLVPPSGLTIGRSGEALNDKLERIASFD